MKKPHIPGVTADYAIVLLQNSGEFLPTISKIAPVSAHNL